jgi:hypothetical protein
VLHGAEPIIVRLFVDRDQTSLEVFDGGSAMPEIKPVEPGGAGRGLRIVTSLCEDWGVVPNPEGGKTVWCTIDAGGTDPDRADGLPHRRTADHPESTLGR